MAEIKKISTELQLLDKFLDTSGDAGTSGQILSSTGTGINWVSGGSLPGGPYLPLAGGRITGTNKIEFNNGTQFIQASDGVDLKLGASDDIILETNFVRYLGAVEYARITGGASSWIASPSTSKLGIGTTSPNAKLDVKGDGADFFLQSADYKIARIQPRGTGADLDRGLFSLFNGNTESVRIDTAGNSWLNGGNVGIGTTSPGAKLDVVGKINQTVSSGANSAVFTNSDATNGYGVAIQSEGTANTRYALILRNLDGSDVYGGVSTMTNQVGFWGVGASPTATLGSRLTVGGNASIGTSYTGTAAPSNGMIVQGNVGIGTTSPGAKLQIGSATNAPNANLGNNLLQIKSPSGFAYLTIGNGDVANSTSYIGGASGFTVIGSVTDAGALSEHARVTNTGNVGIGTTNPVTLLDIRGAGTTSNPATSGTTPSTGTRFRIASSTGASAVIDFGISSSGRSWLQSTDRTDLGAEYPFLLNPNGGNVGIGTTSPEVKLTIKGDALNTNQPVRITNSVTDTHTGLFLNNTGGTVGEKYGMQFGGYNQYSIGGIFGVLDSVSGNTSGDITFDFGNGTSAGSLVEKMRITHEGNVGINCTPSYKLQWSDGTRTGLLDTNIGAVVIGSVSNDALALYTNLTEKMRIDSSGVIKFNAYDGTNNTGSPTHILGTDAGGNVVKSTAGGSIGPWLPLAGGTMTGVTQFNDHTNYGDQVYARFGASQDLQIFHNGTDSFIDNYTGSLTIRNRQDDGHIVFTCDDGSGGLASYLTLNGNNTHAYFTNPGNVGIGTTSPDYKFEVQGVISSADAGLQKATFANVGNDLVLTANADATNATANILFKSSGAGGAAVSEKMRIDSSGNVGIGKTPSEKLDVEGNIQAVNTAGTAVSYVDIVSGATWRLASNPTSGTNSYGLDIIKGSSGTDVKMSIDSSGNVGIGTTSPNQKLQVGGNLHVYDEEGDTDASIFLSTGTSNVTTVKIASNGDSFFNGGNVGIGTTSPVSKLEVSSGPGANGDCILTVSADTDNSTATSNPKLLMLQKGSTKTSLIEMDSSNRTHFSNSDGYYFSGGNVGIGTTSPSQKLEVAGSVAVTGTNVTVANASNPYIYINDTNAGAGIFQQEGNTTRIGSDSNTQVVLVQNNATAVTIDTSKNVGIGTTSPDYKLEVNGTLGVNRTDGIIFAGSAAPGYGNKITVDTSNDFIFSTSLPSAPYTTSEKMRIANGGATTFASTVTATNFILSSDERLKENIEKVCDNRVKADWKTFELKTEKGQKRYGVIAQELEKTNPEFVREDSQGFKSVAYIDLLIAKIAELEARLEKLEK